MCEVNAVKLKKVIWSMVKKLRQKLQVESESSDYIKTICEIGYLFYN